VFEKWDKEVKGEIQPEGVREMLGEMGMHVTVEEAGDFVREVEAGGQVLKLSGFLKVVEEPKRISYFSDKSGIPLQLL
jgi:Ca2+-binding EF-hand superfamily protein